MKKSALTSLLLVLLSFSINLNAQICGPQFHDVYDLPAGSVFQYKTTISSESPEEKVLIETYTVTSIWESGDTLFYSREGTYESTLYHLGFDRVVSSTENGIIDDVVFLLNTPDEMTNYCEDQLIPIDKELGLYSYPLIENNQKIIGGEDNLYKYDQDNNLINFNSSEEYGYFFRASFKKGEGLQKISYGNIMAKTKTECEGSIIDGVATGVFKNTGTGINAMAVENDIKIYPTILEADGLLRVESGRDINNISVIYCLI